MTQTTLAPPPVEETAYEVAGGSRRTLLVAGGVVAALVLGGGGYMLLAGGSSDPSPAAGPVRKLGTNGKTALNPVKPAVVKPAAQLPPTSSVPLGRDPFRALYIEPVAAPVAAEKPATTPTTTGSTSTTTTGSTGSTGSTTTKPTVYKLVLKSVDDSGSAPVATFSVGGKLMLAKPGSVFGPTSELKLLNLTEDPKLGWVAALQVGDSEPIDAAEGATLYVR